jgi:hypothetical protein
MLSRRRWNIIKEKVLAQHDKKLHPQYCCFEIKSFWTEFSGFIVAMELRLLCLREGHGDLGEGKVTKILLNN